MSRNVTACFGTWRGGRRPMHVSGQVVWHLRKRRSVLPPHRLQVQYLAGIGFRPGDAESLFVRAGVVEWQQAGVDNIDQAVLDAERGPADGPVVRRRCSHGASSRSARAARARYWARCARFRHVLHRRSAPPRS